MRVSLFALLALAAPFVAAASIQSDKVANDNAVDLLRFQTQNSGVDAAANVKQNSFESGDDDKCPDLKVLCIKKGDDGEEIVGDCNVKYPVKCAAQCYSQGSPI
ncbi:hypothetical protein JCM11641_007257 [Rhodosporidiobolus odoratus]